MKLFFLILSLLTMVTVSCSSYEAPENVKESFTKKYPGAIEVTWRLDRNDMQEAHFILDDEKYRADFLLDGTWIETEQNVDWDELPDHVKQAFKTTKADGEDIIEIEKVDHYQKGVYYEIEYKRKGEKKDIEIRPNGKINKEE